MKTTLLTPETDENAVKTAAELIRAGEVSHADRNRVRLAANALNGEAVKKIFLAKGRPQDNPLIVHIADLTRFTTCVWRFRRRPSCLQTRSGRVR